MGTSEISFICSEIGTNDYLPEDLMPKKFTDAADWLWNKHDAKIREFVTGNLSGFETSVFKNDRSRAPLSFSYVDSGGKFVPIDHTENIMDFAPQKTDTIFWQPTVVGGQSPNQLFGIHAQGILGNRKYGNWKPIIEGIPGEGIKAVGPDPQDIVRTWMIKPSNNYPQTAPIITSEPPYINDICWKSGVLNYTGYTTKNGSPWTDLVRKSQNPLHALIIELLLKYKLRI